MDQMAPITGVYKCKGKTAIQFMLPMAMNTKCSHVIYCERALIKIKAAMMNI